MATADPTLGPLYLWVHTLTGECTETPQDSPDWERVPRDGLFPTAADEADTDAEWLGDWYTRRIVEIDARIEALTAQYQRVLKQEEARRKAIDWRYGQRFEAVVRAALVGATRRSVDFAYGRAGYRRNKRIEVVDELAAMTWAAEHCPTAIKRAVPYLLKSALPKDVEVPGVERVEEDRFYVQKGGAR